MTVHPSDLLRLPDEARQAEERARFVAELRVIGERVRALDYDAIVEMDFADRAAMERDMGGATFQAAARHASSAWLMDLAGSRSMVVEMVEGLARPPGS